MSLARVPEPSIPLQLSVCDLLRMEHELNIITNRAFSSITLKYTHSDPGPNSKPLCVKVSFVYKDTPSLSPLPQYFEYRGNDVKFINRTDAIEQTLQAQHNMHVTLKDYKNANFIPNVLGSCTVPPGTFNSYFEKRGHEDHLVPAVRNEIDLIVRKANENACDVNVLVMEFFEGFTGCTVADEKYNSDIIAAILSVLIITGCLSLDTHRDNIMKKYDESGRIILKLIDWDKYLSLYEPGDLNKDKILGWLDSLNPASMELLSQWLSSYELGSAEGKDPITIDILTDEFNKYYTYLQQLLPKLLSQWNTSQLTYNQKIYYTFELVTFLGLMDGLSRNATYPGGIIKCSWLMHSLFGRFLQFECISLDDWLKFRPKFIDFFKEKSTQPDITRGQEGSVKKAKNQEDEVTKVLTGIVEKLNSLLRKSSASGGHSRYLKRTRHKVIKKTHFNKNNRKSIKKLRRSLPYKYKHIRRVYSHYKPHKH